MTSASSPIQHTATGAELLASAPLGRPKRTLHRKMLMWMLVLGLLPVGASLAMFHFVVREQLRQSHEAEGGLLAEVIAAGLTDRVQHWNRHEGELLDNVSRDPRMSFLCVTDADGKILHAGIFDGAAWTQFADMHPRLVAERRLNMTEASEHVDELIIRRAAILPRAAGGAGRTAGAAKRTATDAARPIGYVIVGVHDRLMNQSMKNFQFAMVIALCVVALITIPLVRMMLRGWSRPLGALVEATRRLGKGQQPEPVAIMTNDELGFLAGAFNDMAARLLGSRRQLINANETLERKVQERTAALEEAVRKLDSMASTDPLTGLANRRAFTAAIDRLYAESATYQRELACVLIDLDGFKGVNDTLGHDKGDELLTLAAEVIRSNAPHGSVPARLGGDEFVLVMPLATCEAAKATAEQLLEQFVERSRELLADTRTGLRVSMSMGLACLSKTKAVSSAELLSQADKALYRAKESGKSCLMVYQHDGVDADDASGGDTRFSSDAA